MKRNPRICVAALACVAGLAASAAATVAVAAEHKDSAGSMMDERRGGMMGDESPAMREGRSGGAVSDASITTRVKALLLAEPDLKSTDISVKTVDGVVQLSGFASSKQDIDRAVEIARGVKNVKSVENELRTR